MPRLIDADSIKSAKYHDLPYTHIHPVGVDVQAYEMGWNDALDAVADSAPTVDAEPVRHGRWTNISVSVTGNSSAECSRCGAVVHDCFSNTINYCPNCGAKMDGERREDDGNRTCRR